MIATTSRMSSFFMIGISAKLDNWNNSYLTKARFHQPYPKNSDVQMQRYFFCSFPRFAWWHQRHIAP